MIPFEIKIQQFVLKSVEKDDGVLLWGKCVKSDPFRFCTSFSGNLVAERPVPIEDRKAVPFQYHYQWINDLKGCEESSARISTDFTKGAPSLIVSKPWITCVIGNCALLSVRQAAKATAKHIMTHQLSKVFITEWCFEWQSLWENKKLLYTDHNPRQSMLSLKSL